MSLAGIHKGAQISTDSVSPRTTDSGGWLRGTPIRGGSHLSPGSGVAFGNSQGEGVAWAEQNLRGVMSVSEAHGRGQTAQGT